MPGISGWETVCLGTCTSVPGNVGPGLNQPSKPTAYIVLLFEVESKPRVCDFITILLPACYLIWIESQTQSLNQESKPTAYIVI